MSTRTTTRDRRNPGLGDMVRSIVVLLLIIAGIAVVRSFTNAEQTTPVRTVDYLAYAEQAQEGADYRLAVPPELPEGWRSTSVRFSAAGPTTWHLGLLTDTEEYVGVEQTDGSPESVLEDYAPESEPVGVAEIEGEPWRVRSSDDPEQLLLIRTDEEVTTVVLGSVDQQVLEDFVERLP